MSSAPAGRAAAVTIEGVSKLYEVRDGDDVLALERVASVTRQHLIMQTQVDMLAVDRPAMAFYPGTELNGDPSNWVGPNPAAVKAMLEDVGFTRIEILFQSFPDVVPIDTLKTIQTNHITLHAWK